MPLGATIKKVLKIALMSLGASSPEKKPSPPPAADTKPAPGTKPALGTEPGTKSGPPK